MLAVETVGAPVVDAGPSLYQRHRFYQVQWWTAVAVWSFHQSLRMAEVVERTRVSRFVASRRTSSIPHRAGPTIADGSVWGRLAACESSGNWAAATGNGFYGGLQFTLSTWRAYGGSGMPNDASRETQIAVGERVLAGQGPRAWPRCSYVAGLR